MSDFDFKFGFVFDYSFVLFILFAVFVGASGPYYLLKNQRKVAAITVLLLFLTVLIFFGMRWFDGSHLRTSMQGSLADVNQWPPQINPCPDFLSLKTDGPELNPLYCVDTMGITSMPIFNANSHKSTPNEVRNHIPLTKGTSANDYSTQYFITTPVTWEGVYDGITAANIVVPYPGA